MANLPVILRMEYAIYDPLQRWFTVDTQDDIMYTKYKQSLSEVYCINLDGSFFIDETNRVDRKRLSHLLAKLHEHSFKSVFLDFSFEPLRYNNNQSPDADSLLIESMKPLKDRLITPYGVRFASKNFDEEYEIKDIIYRSTQLFTPKHNGYTAPLYQEGDNLRRYHLFRVEKGIERSAIFGLLEVENGTKEVDKLFKKVPDKFEINFAFRNKKKNAERDAVSIMEAQYLLGKSHDELKQALHNKTVFIGLFQPRLDHFENLIDGIDTPIKDDMNGIYLLMNTYFNVLHESYMRRPSFWLVLLINLLVASLGIYYYNHRKKQLLPSVFREAKGVLIYLTVLFLLITGLYVTANIKFPFVVGSVLFIKLKTLKTQFELLVDRIYRDMSKIFKSHLITNNNIK